jgi:hypothetical protein
MREMPALRQSKTISMIRIIPVLRDYQAITLCWSPSQRSSSLHAKSRKAALGVSRAGGIRRGFRPKSFYNEH